MKIINCKIKFRNRFSKSWCKCDERCWRCNFHTFWYNFVRKKRKTRTFRWNQWCKNYLKLKYSFWCCKSDERNKWISRSFWKCNESKYREFWNCFWWNCWWNWWDCCWDFIFFFIEISFRNEFIYFLRCRDVMLTNVFVKFIFRLENFLAMFTNDFSTNCLNML